MFVNTEDDHYQSQGPQNLYLERISCYMKNDIKFILYENAVLLWGEHAANIAQHGLT